MLHRLEQEPEYEEIRFIDLNGRQRLDVRRNGGILGLNYAFNREQAPIVVKN